MSKSKAIFIVGLVLAVLIAAILGIEALRGRNAALETLAGGATLPPGSIPIYVDGALAAGFVPADLEQLEQVSFVDAEEGKTQAGWRLADILALYLDTSRLAPETCIVVTSSSREKSAELTWDEVRDPANRVMFDLSGRGTLKLVSVLERLDTRDEWVQDVDCIEVKTR